MFFLRLILLIFLGLLVRRIYLSVKSGGTRLRGPRSNGRTFGKQPPSGRAMKKDLTEQDIDDADFEEIP